MTPSAERFSIPVQIVHRRVHDEIVVLDLRSRTCFSLERVAALIWEAVQEGATVTELVARVVAEYDVDPAAAKHDVERFLAELESSGLLEPVREGNAGAIS